jgi:alkylhydroperoxidase family enzyme
VSPHLAPIKKPKGLRMKLLYRFLGRQFGKPPGWLTVFSARMPFPFTSWMGKVDKLNKKLSLPADSVALIRAQVDSLNTCTWCEDAGRWYAINKTPELVPKLDALDNFHTSPLFSERERAALDFATELTEFKNVGAEGFAAVSRHYSEREICEIVWVVSSNHLFNLNNLGLGIGSDGLCELGQQPRPTADRGALE